jgi:hypothetical protein
VRRPQRVSGRARLRTGGDPTPSSREKAPRHGRQRLSCESPLRISERRIPSARGRGLWLTGPWLWALPGTCHWPPPAPPPAPALALALALALHLAPPPAPASGSRLDAPALVHLSRAPGAGTWPWHLPLWPLPQWRAGPSEPMHAAGPRRVATSRVLLLP